LKVKHLAIQFHVVSAKTFNSSPIYTVSGGALNSTQSNPYSYLQFKASYSIFFMVNHKSKIKTNVD